MCAKENRKISIKKISPYAKSKYLSEVYLKKLNYSKYSYKKIILRLPGIIGDGNHKNFISNLLIKAKKRKKIKYFGGQNMFNNTYHINDFSSLLKKLMTVKINYKFLVLNVGTNNPIRISKIFELIEKKYNLKKKEINSDKKNVFTLNMSKLNIFYKKKIDTSMMLTKFFKIKG